MRDYGTISPKFWIGATGKSLRGHKDAQILAAYLMTSPHAAATGVYHLPIFYVTYETGLTMEEASKALQRLSEGAFCEYDAASETVFVINMAAYQIAARLGPKDKRVPWLKKELDKMPEPLKARFLAIYGVAFCLIEQDEEQSPSEGPSKGHPARRVDQDLDQDLDQEQDQDLFPTASPTPRATKSSRKSNADPDWLPDFKREYPKRLGDQGWRKAVRAGNARIAEGHTPAEFIAGAKRYCAQCEALEKIGTEYVKQAATFLGRDKHFLEPWPLPPSSPRPNGVTREPRRHKEFGS